jgi:cell division protein FtsW (lipid II flippase)
MGQTQPMARDPASIWALRRPERQLLLAALACLAIGFLLALGSVAAAGRAPDPADLLPLASYGLCLVLLHLALVLGGFRGDQVLVVAAAFLGGLGLLIQTRMGLFEGAAPLDLVRLVFPAGILVMAGTALVFMDGRYRVLAAYPWVWAGLSLALVAVLLATGQRFRGAVFGLGLTTPTEVLKVSLVIFLAGLVDREGRALGAWHPSLPLPPWRPLWPLAACWAVLTGLLLLQRDLGMVAILGVALLAILSAGTGRIGYTVYGLLAAAGLGWLLLGVFEHGQERLRTWLDPFADPTGDGWQILQGLSGMFAGGLWGEGFGQGSPRYTPIAESDFVYTAIGEELGFLGCAIVLCFYLLPIERGLAIAARGRTGFGRLLATGLCAVLAAQTLLNIGGVTKLIPLTGLTLPLVSQGGASLLVTCAALGLLLAVSDDQAGAPRRGPSHRPQPRAHPSAHPSAQPRPRAGPAEGRAAAGPADPPAQGTKPKRRRTRKPPPTD